MALYTPFSMREIRLPAFSLRLLRLFKRTKNVYTHPSCHQHPAPTRLSLWQFPLMLLLGFLLAACDSNGSNAAAPPPPVIATGNVVKGTMANASVSLYNVAAGSKGSLIASATANAAGEFTLSVPSSETGPFLLEASATSTTQLRCDVWEGCGSNAGSPDDKNLDGLINFGENYPSPSLTLTAIVADANAINALSITPLTHFASRFAGSFPQGWDSLSTAIAHSQLSNLFGFGSDLSGLKAFDITQPAPAGVTLDQWHYSLLTAAFAAVASGGPASSELGAWIDQEAGSFALQNGQLLALSDDSGALSAEALVTYARALANHLNPAAEPFFARLQLLLAAKAPGQLTDAQPNAGIGNATLDNVNAFLDDWRTWRDDLPLHAQGTPFADSAQPQYQDYLQAQWTLTQVLASASQYAPYAAAPDLALGHYCEVQYGATILFSLCNSLIANKTICLAGLSVNGEPFCDYLTHLPLPLNNGLIATVDIFAQTAQLSGTLNGQTINLWMVAEQSSTQQITMHISGDIIGERYAWSLMDGTNTFNYTKPLSLTNFQLPDSLASDLTLNYTAYMDNATSLSGQLTSKLAVELDPWRAIQWASDLETALPVVPMTLEMTGNFTSPYSGTGYVYIKGGAQPWLEFELPQQSPHNGLLAQVRLSGDLAQWQSGLLNASVKWDGHSLTANYTNDQLTLQNGNGVRLIMPEGGENAGNLYAGSQRYGRLFFEDEGWWVQLADYSEEAL